ncbi:phenazine biosynthesis FMN-dependent oxidase PhzG [Streptomyces sp. MUM 178J]|uniref:phenazine biosynthesis FMN-dependent oxidase PhzG n=1 Tax=Streptomyces sp. MUM 178J TaxID=2791991 RepID=UPI0027E2A9A9|nr:phenazine biosynthesis FMN-dependent oxidase PhzG [Streptomyces sp. MUM 178J]WRQ81280.1 phenazine biosynthesis FMN-dependent oxidase PhzG [Streptomyces sp. MUM 178J]
MTADTSRFESLSGETDLPFPEYDTPPFDPMDLFRGWLADATARGVREPLSTALSTADARGRASSRIVTITEVRPRGLVFITHTTSRKARDLAATGWASALLYWRETGQQIALAGPTAELPAAESEALWSARPTPLHPMSTASRQSEPLADPAALRAESGRLAAPGGPLPRPLRFAGYLLTPEAVEFWCAASDRLHRRLRYTDQDGHWRTERLQP